MKFLKLLFICILFSSCGGDPCEDLDCGEHGTCDEATEKCICDQYYEGDLCADEVRAKFINSLSGRGECDYNPGNVFNLDLAITPGLDVNTVKIQSSSILQDFTMTGMLDEEGNIEIPTFRAHIGLNDHDGTIVHNSSNGETIIVMTLNAYVNGVKNTCTYTFFE